MKKNNHLDDMAQQQLLNNILLFTKISKEIIIPIEFVLTKKESNYLWYSTPRLNKYETFVSIFKASK